jgi:hypothetical protein
MHKCFFFLIAFLLGCSALLPAQYALSPNLMEKAFVRQSSYQGFGRFNPLAETEAHVRPLGGGASISTDPEDSPWWQVDLQAPAQVQTLQFDYNQPDYPAGHPPFYILLSAYPMDDPDLMGQLACPAVDHIYVSDAPAGRVQVPLGSRTVRYIRIQLAGKGQLICHAPQVTGYTNRHEIGANGIDDDADGKTDCDDPDIRPVFRAVLASSPSCPDCADGALYISAGGRDLSISIDGGRTYERVKAPDFGIPVAAGSYQLVLSTPDGCTAEYTRNPVVVGAAAREEMGCNNGNFQNGWTNWKGALGQHTQASGIFFNKFVIDPAGLRHALITSNPLVADPHVGSNIPLESPTGASTFARLGNLMTSNDSAQRLTYCFMVDPVNAHFSFWYAAVLFDAPHDITSEKAVFSWTIRDAAGLAVASGAVHPHMAGETQKFNSTTFFAPWNCASADLSAQIGQQVCVEFITAGCAFGVHGGYAYIDGLCETPVAASIQLQDQTCVNPGKIDATATGGSDYFGYFWEVEKVDANGNPVPNTLASGQVQSGAPIAPFTDILGFWRSQFPGQKVQCGDQFRVTLNLNGRCPSNVIRTSQVFTARCPPSPVDYCNLAICPNYTGPVQMQGTGSCPTCLFSWRPPDNLNDSHIAFPTLLPTAPPSGFYQLTIESTSGCQIRQSVEVWQIPVLNGQLTAGTQCSGPCSVALTAAYTTNQQINPARMLVQATKNGSTTSIPLVYQSVDYLPNGFKRYKFVSGLMPNSGGGPNGSNSVQYTITMKNLVPAGFCKLGICEPGSLLATVSVSKGIFWGYPNVYIPNVFDLTASNPVNRVFNPFFSTGNPDPAVYWMSMEIYDRWGSLVYQNIRDLNASCDATVGLAGNEPGFPWNGHWDNDLNEPLAPQDVYTYVIKYKNCQNEWQMGGDVALLW